jgi:hypothetical protein
MKSNNNMKKSGKRRIERYRLNGAVLVVLEQIPIVVWLQGRNAKTSASLENDDSGLF